MNRILGCAAIAIALVAITAPAEAKGCIKGALVGGARGISPVIMAFSVLPQDAPSATTKQTSARTLSLTQRGALRSLPLSDNHRLTARSKAVERGAGVGTAVGGAAGLLAGLGLLAIPGVWSRGCGGMACCDRCWRSGGCCRWRPDWGTHGRGG